MQVTEPIFDHKLQVVYRRAIDSELDRVGKTNLNWIVSMLTRLIQQTETASEGSNEYEYRDAEDEKKHSQTTAPNLSIELS